MKLKKELPLIAIISLPFLYLAYVWSELPAKVPMHWNLKGEIDRFGDKSELILIPILLPLLVYITFLIIPKIDPKSEISKMGNKFQAIKTILTIFMSGLALVIIHSAKIQSISHLTSNYMLLLMGILYLILGNYFKVIKPNYFIGIRTPWTLENETVWKETHKMAGKMWFVGGFVIILSSLILNKDFNHILFLIITGIITVIPIAYSYFRFQSLKNGNWS